MDGEDLSILFYQHTFPDYQIMSNMPHFLICGPFRYGGDSDLIMNNGAAISTFILVNHHQPCRPDGVLLTDYEQQELDT